MTTIWLGSFPAFHWTTLPSHLIHFFLDHLFQILLPQMIPFRATHWCFLERLAPIRGQNPELWRTERWCWGFFSKRIVGDSHKGGQVILLPSFTSIEKRISLVSQVFGTLLLLGNEMRVLSLPGVLVLIGTEQDSSPFLFMCQLL
jgi:hypothetical protein